MKKPQIKIFVTKTREFRARIKETKDSPIYEVTVGGTQWQAGKGRKYEKEIRRKCEILLSVLNSKLSAI